MFTVIGVLLLALAAIEIVVMVLGIRNNQIPQEFKYVALSVGVASIPLLLSSPKWLQVISGLYVATPVILFLAGIFILTMIAGK